MNRLLLLLAVLVLMNGSPAVALPVPINSPASIRDIRGPLKTSGPPPFSRAVAVLLVASLYLAVGAKIRRGRNRMVAPSPIPPTSMDVLEALRIAYSLGDLSVLHLFEQLAAIACSQLVQNDGSAMTSEEVLEATGDAVPAELITVVADLFAVCDRVRFGGYRPDTSEVTEAFTAVQLLLERRPGGVP
jgi:hypothetical protein